MNFLGLDASTSAVGWAILDERETIVAHGTFNLKNIKTGLLDKADELRYNLEKLKETYTIDKIGIEDILQKTAVGSAHTICVLSGFNCLTQYICKEVFGIKAELVKFSVARKLFNIVRVDKSEKMKISVFNYISEFYKDAFKINYKKTNKVTDETYDSSDAVLVAKYLARTYDDKHGTESEIVVKKIRKVQKNRK